MQSAAFGAIGGAGTARSARLLVLAYLICGLVSRLADANPHPDFWYLPFVLSCFVLPFWYATGWRRVTWARRPWLLLGIQAVLTYLPIALFGSTWVPGVSGLLGGLVLVNVAPRVSWWIFGGLVAIELGAWLMVGLPYEPPISAALWILNGFTNVSLGLYGMVQASALLERLESTAEVLTARAVEGQRLATADGLQATIVTQLDEVRRYAEAARSARGVEQTTRALAGMGRVAREAAASARRIASVVPAHAADDVEAAIVTPALARRVVGTVVVLFAMQYLLNTVFPTVGGALASPPTSAAAIAIAMTMVWLQMRHSRYRPEGPPRGWPLTLGIQVVLCFALYPVFGVASTLFLAFIGGSALLLIPHPSRWAVFAAVIVALPVLTLVNPGDLQGIELQVRWCIYASGILAAASLLIYGLGRFNRAAAALAEARRRLAESAATGERIRIARDTHDTLGLALSTIALKSDLATALVSRDRPRALREIAQALHLARTVRADAALIVGGNLQLRVAQELETAREALEAAGVAVHIDDEHDPLPAELETPFAAILREAVANVLRHSEARTCDIRIARAGDEWTLVVSNDGAHGVADGPPDGRGLANIRERVADLGGHVEVRTHGARFEVAVATTASGLRTVRR